MNAEHRQRRRRAGAENLKRRGGFQVKNVQLWVYGVHRGVGLLDQSAAGSGCLLGGGVPVNRLPGIFTEGRCRAPICADYFLKPRPGFNNSQLRAVRHLPSPVTTTTPPSL